MALPKGELPWGVFGRINLKTGLSLGRVDDKTEMTDEQIEKIRVAAREILGPWFKG